MPLPEFDPETGNLPPGVHDATWSDVESQLTFTERRKMLAANLLKIVHMLAFAGCSTLYLDGSFTSRKLEPNDWDACYETAGVDPRKMQDILFLSQRRFLRRGYFGDLFPIEGKPCDMLDFFQLDHLQYPKGIVRLDLSEFKPKGLQNG